MLAATLTVAMESKRSSEKVHPGIALALLTSLRDKDTPDEAIEDEAFSDSLPRRLGLNDVINVQMHRYADLKDADLEHWQNHQQQVRVALQELDSNLNTLR